MFRRMSVLTFLLFAVVYASPTYGGDVYLYDNAVVPEVDIGRYLASGEAFFGNGFGAECKYTKGPAPEPYPQILIWENTFEQLGASNVQIDGIRFINIGQHWMKHKLALVLWKIRVPNASLRLPSEFAEDLTLTFWVDWDQSESWDKDEVAIRCHLNLEKYFPTTKGTLVFWYLTAFRVPDVTEMDSNWWWNKPEKDIRYLWTRATIAYDDSDVSPDGQQLFGEAEDYRVSYMVETKKGKER